MPGLRSRTQKRRRANLPEAAKPVRPGRSQNKPGWDETIHDLSQMKLTPSKLANRQAAAVSKHRLPSGSRLARGNTEADSRAEDSTGEEEALEPYGVINFGAVAKDLQRRREPGSSRAGQDQRRFSPLAGPARLEVSETAGAGGQDSRSTAQAAYSQASGSTRTVAAASQQRTWSKDERDAGAVQAPPAASPGGGREKAQQPSQDQLRSEPATTSPAGQPGQAAVAARLAQQSSRLEQRVDHLAADLATARGAGVPMAQVAGELAALRNEQQAIKAGLEEFMAHTSSLLTTLQGHISRLLGPSMPSSSPAPPQHTSPPDRPRPHLPPVPAAISTPADGVAAAVCVETSMGDAAEIMPQHANSATGPGAGGQRQSWHASTSQPLHERNGVAAWPSQWPAPMSHKSRHALEHEDETALPSYARLAAQENLADAASQDTRFGLHPRPSSSVPAEVRRSPANRESIRPQVRAMPGFYTTGGSVGASQDLYGASSRTSYHLAADPAETGQPVQLKPMSRALPGNVQLSGVDAQGTLSLNAWAAAGAGARPARMHHMR